jgi:uncharacterized SAM-binding protein YcdF (DUF218 family)
VRTALVIPGHGTLTGDGLYTISDRCRQLVAEAERLAAAAEPVAVVFTGWSPVGGASEAEQMVRAWRGPDVELVVETTARSTAENASRTAPLLLERGVERAVVLCTLSHLMRVRVFFGRLYGACGIGTRFQTLRAMPTLDAIVWELGALPLLPWQLRAARSELGRRTT